MILSHVIKIHANDKTYKIEKHIQNAQKTKMLKHTTNSKTNTFGELAECRGRRESGDRPACGARGGPEAWRRCLSEVRPQCSTPLDIFSMFVVCFRFSVC